jgi:hypothetical protein
MDTILAVARVEFKMSWPDAYGHTVEEAAAMCGKSPQWVRERISDGTVRVSRTKWESRWVYLSGPMVARLKGAVDTPRPQQLCRTTWLRQSEAATDAGVSNATIIRWAEEGSLERLSASDGWRYHRDAVRARARTYWETARFRRELRPVWLQAECSPHTRESPMAMPKEGLVVGPKGWTMTS